MDAERLRGIPLFASLADEDLRVIATFAEEKSVSAGSVLVREGDFSYDLIAIEEGSASVSREGSEVATLGPGDYFGEIGVLRNEMRAATVTAHSRMRLLTFDTFAFRRMRNMEGVMDAIEKTIASRSG